VLRSLYDRVHGPNADYSEALTRELVVNMIFQVLADPVLRASAFEPGRSISAKEERAHAAELVRKLKEHAWLEERVAPQGRRTSQTLNGLMGMPCHHCRSGPSRKIAKCRCGDSGMAFPVLPT
jgi:hypothetical protein